MKLMYLLAAPAALAMALSPVAAQAEGLFPARAGAVLEQANGQASHETQVMLGVFFLIAVGVGIGLADHDPAPLPTSP